MGQGPHDPARASTRRPRAPPSGACPARPRELADLYARYEPEKRRQRWLDFDDLLAHCADAIERDPDFAAAQRWRFRHLFVDEFQDATPLQTRLLRAWLGDRPDLCVVGDGAQAIYAFAGADASPLTEFARHFPGGRTIPLVHNYRSTDAIVAVAEAALGPGVGRRARCAPRGAPRRARAAPRRVRRRRAGGREVADACWHEFTGGVPWHRMAVLFRTNAQSSLFETAFARRGVPFRLAGAQRFAARPAVRAAARPAARGRTQRARRARSRDHSPTSRPTPTPTPTTTPTGPNRGSDGRPRPRPGAASERRAAGAPRRALGSVTSTRPPKPARLGRRFRRVARARDARRRPATSAASTS